MSELQPGTFRDGFENSMFTGEYLSPTDLIEGDPADGAGVVGVGLGRGGGRGVVGDGPGGGLSGSMGGVVDVI